MLATQEVPRQRFQGKVSRFHADRGWGFIDMQGTDVMVHVNDCKPEDVELFTGGQPRAGDIVTFDIEPRKDNPEHMQAKRVEGGTDERCCNTKGRGQAAPVQGTGKHFGIVKAFSAKGLGWITCAGGTLAWVELADCIGTRLVTGDHVKFDLEQSEAQPGKMQAVNVTGGTAPLDLKDAILGKDLAKMGQPSSGAAPVLKLKKNANGHLVGCVCAGCAAIGMSAMPTMGAMGAMGSMCGVTAMASMGMGAMGAGGPVSLGGVHPKMMAAMMGGKGGAGSSRPGPYSGGIGSMGRLY